jgi:phenylalanine-4-hydroxylase
MSKAQKYQAKKPNSKGIYKYTDEENDTWAYLYSRQKRIIEGKACPEFLAGLEILNMNPHEIPQCSEVSEALMKSTGWSVEPVEKIIPLKTFFELLSTKRFPAATFIRIPEEIDYLKEPDIFHEFFGHCPLLTNQNYADFVENYGKLALQCDKDVQSLLGRLFWFTVEFGLIKSSDSEKMKIYGGGILSSFQETQYALESLDPLRSQFNLNQVLKTNYRYDEIQKQYFYIHSLQELFELTKLELVPFIEKEILGKNTQSQNDQEDFLIC